MAKNKTVPTEISVSDFVAAISDEKRRNDCTTIIALITAHTGLEPKMWGTSIVGFGSYDYRYESGREGSAPLAGMASRANAMVLYLGSEFDERDQLLAQFGKHKTGKGCIYVQKIEDIDTTVLVQMVKNSMAYHQQQHQS